MSNELLQKVITTTHLGGDSGRDGLLAPDQADRFIDYMWDAAVLSGQVRTIRMKSDTMEVDKMGVGKRLLRGATEAVDDGMSVGIAFAKISLTSVKLRLDWELSSESLEDGIEGADLEDHVARLMSSQAGQDLEDLAINGDTTKTGDPLLKMLDGWARRAEEGGHIVDAGGKAIDDEIFHKAIKKMPRGYRQRRGELKFFTGAGVIQDYLYSLRLTTQTFARTEATQTAATPAVAQGPAGFTIQNAFGIPVQEVPLMDETLAGTYSGAGDALHSNLWLTFPKNLLWGVKREIVVYREFKPKKDTIEYTMFTRVATNVENLDAFVVVTNVLTNA
jgi:HK97 family phage major capsid protein